MRLIIKLLLRNDGHRITETKGKNNSYFHPTALILLWDQIHLADYPRSILYNDLTDFLTNVSITTLLMFAKLGWLVKQAWACLTFGLTYDDLFFETLDQTCAGSWIHIPLRFLYYGVCPHPSGCSWLVGPQDDKVPFFLLSLAAMWAHWAWGLSDIHTDRQTGQYNISGFLCVPASLCQL